MTAWKRSGGGWTTTQKPPVRYTPRASYSTPCEFIAACVERLLAELGEVSATEVFSAIYAAARPWGAVAHSDVLDVLDERCTPSRARGMWQIFRAQGQRI